MKRSSGSMLTVFVICCVIGFVSAEAFAPGGCSAGELTPIVTVSTPVVKFDKKATVVIMGAGFQPGQEIRILVGTPGEADSDLDGALKPDPEVSSAGTWATTWDAGMYIGKKIIDPGAAKITVTDAEYNPIAHTPLFIQKEEKPKEDKKKK